MLYCQSSRGGLAQLGERFNGIEEVSGSIPLSSTSPTSFLNRFTPVRTFVAAFAAVLCITLLAASASRAQSPWESEILYQIFPRSYRDSNGDRIGDLAGITAELGTIRKLGCTAILLNPIVRSRVYHNYFADDFYTVDPAFGTLEDFRTLVREAHRRHLKVLLDMEPQYVADGHPWLRAAKADPHSPYAGYLWDQSGSAFSGDGIRWYDGRRISVAPVNTDNPIVQSEIRRIFRFWTRQGVDDFRIDHMMDDLDNKHVKTGLFAKIWNPVETDVRRIRPGAFFVGEQADWGSGTDILHATRTDAVFDFPLWDAITHWDVGKLQNAVRLLASVTPAGRTQVSFLENHDTERFASAQPDARRQRLAAALLFTLKGTPAIYDGQELGMRGVKGDWGSDGNDIPLRLAYRWTSRLDDAGTAIWYRGSGPWWSTTYSADHDGVSLAEEERDPQSLLFVYRRLARLRLAHPALRPGSQDLVPVTDPHVFAFRRRQGAETIVVVANLGDTATSVRLPFSASLHDLWSGTDTPSGTPVSLPAAGYAILRLGDGRGR